MSRTASRHQAREHSRPERRRVYPQCETCGKVCYPSRKAARARAAIIFPGQRVRVYECGPAIHVTSWSTAKTTVYREYGWDKAG